MRGQCVSQAYVVRWDSTLPSHEIFASSDAQPDIAPNLPSHGFGSSAGASGNSFHVNGGSSEFAACFRYVLAYPSALSLPCSISSTGPEGAIQLFVLTLYTDACTP